MRFASFNVLADDYIGYGDYSHVDPKLLIPGARLGHIIRQINSLQADVIGLQEADKNVTEAFAADENWQTLWVPKRGRDSDGCLTLIKSHVAIDDYKSFPYDDEFGHVFQITQIGKVSVANTHIRYAPADDSRHIGVSQTRQLLKALDDRRQAVILADCNDRPGGPVKKLIYEAGFTNVGAERPTAFVNKIPAAIDLLAVRGLSARWVPTNYNLSTIPNETCASDHIPLVADVEV